MSHTPGPWKLTVKRLPTTNDSNINWFVTAGHPGVRIAERLGARKTALPNAHLITAAPELLESLKATAALLADGLDAIIDANTLFDDAGKPDPSTVDDRVRPAIEQLKRVLGQAYAAIAKAEDGTAPARQQTQPQSASTAALTESLLAAGGAR